MIRRWSRSRPINKYSQRPMLARSEHFEIDHFEPARTRHPLRNLPELIFIKSHVFSNLIRNSRAEPAPNEKVGFRPLVCFDSPDTTTQQYSSPTIRRDF